MAGLRMVRQGNTTLFIIKSFSTCIWKKISTYFIYIIWQNLFWTFIQVRNYNNEFIWLIFLKSHQNMNWTVKRNFFTWAFLGELQRVKLLFLRYFLAQQCNFKLYYETMKTSNFDKIKIVHYAPRTQNVSYLASTSFSTSQSRTSENYTICVRGSKLSRCNSATSLIRSFF